MGAVEQHDLEGIVAKRKSDPYQPSVKWWKIKNPAYSQAEGRRELFNSDGRAIAMLRKKPTTLRTLFSAQIGKNPNSGS